MGQVIRSLEWWWDYFRKLFNIRSFSIDGTITLAAGKQEISVSTYLRDPKRVFVSVEEPSDAVTTCVGDLNFVAARVVENGFVIYADIKSDSCDISYFVEYDTGRSKPIKT